MKKEVNVRRNDTSKTERKKKRMVRFPSGKSDFSLFEIVQTGSGALSTLYLILYGQPEFGVKRSG
jgi:hypothetical protein